MSGTENSEDLIRQFLKGDNYSFEKLIRKEEVFINKMLCVLLNFNNEDINDVKQEIYLALFIGLKKFNFKSSFKSYLFIFVKNKAVDFIRKQKRIVNLKQHLFNNRTAYKDPSAEESCLKAFEKENIHAVIGKLNEDERLLILLKDIEDYSISDIAEMIRMKEGTVKSKLHRSRIKLYNFMKEDQNA